MRTPDQNELIAKAVGAFIDGLDKKIIGARETHPRSIMKLIENDLLAFCAAVQDKANDRVSAATEQLRDRYAQAALSGLAPLLRSFNSYENNASESQTRDASEIASRAWLLADAVMEKRG